MSRSATRLEMAAIEMCRAIREAGDVDVDFYYDNGMDVMFRVTKVPTIRIRSGGLETVCDDEGVRAVKP